MKRNYILLSCFILLFAACQPEEDRKQEEATFVATSVVKMDTLIFNEYVCQIRSSQHIELRALEKGYLQKIYVDEGQFVRKGQLMFQILPVIYQAEMQKAAAEAEFARIEYENTKSLADSNIVSPNELALAKARYNKALAELELAHAHLGFTEIRAPFDGIMDRFQVRLGSLVDEGELLSTLSDNSEMWVYFNVPESEYLEYAGRKKTTEPMQVKLQMANNRIFEFQGVVETIEADFNNETGNIAFRASFPNPDGLLRHGETGNILMPVLLSKALLIPQKCTFEILDKKFVFVVDTTGTVFSREIRIGREMPHLYEVVGGLKEGEKILVDGLRKVKNKQEIKCQFRNLRAILAELEQLHAE